MSLTIRAATAADQRIINKLVFDARLNPLQLDWRNFLVAKRFEGNTPRIVGIGQLRPHSDGTVELGSMVVVPEEQGRGIGSQLVEALMHKANGKLYLMCNAPKVTYYQRFGFQELLTCAEMPRSMRRIHQMSMFIEGLFVLITRKSLRIAIMAHPGINP